MVVPSVAAQAALVGALREERKRLAREAESARVQLELATHENKLLHSRNKMTPRHRSGSGKLFELAATSATGEKITAAAAALAKAAAAHAAAGVVVVRTEEEEVQESSRRGAVRRYEDAARAVDKENADKRKAKAAAVGTAAAGAASGVETPTRRGLSRRA